MKTSFWIRKHNFVNGASIPLKNDSIVGPVGLNNGGKSLTLKEIAAKAMGYYSFPY